MTKVCTKCGEEKPVEEFHKSSKSKDGRNWWCKSCMSGYYSERFPEKQEEYKDYRALNAERIAAYKRRYRSEYPDRCRASFKQWYDGLDAAGRGALAATQAAWSRANRDKVARGHRERNRIRRATDPGFVARERVRSRLTMALRGAYKSASTFELVGCTPSELVKHLESKFLPGMTWENRRKWHIDHILPCAIFDLTDPVEQKQCFHFTNLQPLWAKDNLKKHARVERPRQVAA